MLKNTQTIYEIDFLKIVFLLLLVIQLLKLFSSLGYSSLSMILKSSILLLLIFLDEFIIQFYKEESDDLVSIVTYSSLIFVIVGILLTFLSNASWENLLRIKIV